MTNDISVCVLHSNNSYTKTYKQTLHFKFFLKMLVNLN